MMKIRKYILSTIMLFMSIHLSAQIYMPTEYVSVCSNQGTYYWHGQEINKSGKYTDVVDDYVYTLQITMDAVVRSTKNLQMPKGSAISYRGKDYKKAGVYYDTINGGETYCDTIEKIVINYALEYHFYDTIHTCGPQSITWQGKVRNQAKDYIEKYRTVDNTADSIYHLALFFDQATGYYQETKYWCKDKLPYIWNGLKLYKDCDTTRTLKTKYGCDSIVTLHLRLKPTPQRTKITISNFCASDGYYTHGKQIHTETTFTDTLISYCGCDSIVDSIFKPFPNGYFKQNFMQHFKGEKITWRGKVFDKDTIAYDTLPGKDSYGCYKIEQLILVTKFEKHKTRDLCYGDTAQYKGKDGKFIVDHDTTFIEYHIATTGGDSVVYFEFYFKPKVTIKVDSITICGNEKYTWYYDPSDSKKSKVIDGKAYKNQSKVQMQTVTQSLGDCQEAKLIVTVVPYYEVNQTVIMCNEDVVVNPYKWKDHYGREYVFGQPNMDKTIRDTLNAPNFHTPGDDIEMGECDSIVVFRFISTSSCSKMDTFHLCEGDSLYIDKKWYFKPGVYHNTMQSITHKSLGLQDSTHNFTIIKAQTDTASYTIYRCESDAPSVYHGKEYIKSGKDTIHVPFKGQSCDSAVIYVEIHAKPQNISPIQYFHFCTQKDIYVKTVTGKILTTPGYHTDTIAYSYDQGCDSIYQYYIHTHGKTDQVDSAYIRPGETYKWTYHGQDSILTQAGIYIDSTTVAFGCDSIHRLVLNWNIPHYELTVDTGCANHPYVWRGQNYYNDTTVVDTVYNIKKDSIFELQLTINPTKTYWRYIHLLPDTSYNFHGHILTLAQHMNKTFVDTTTSIQTGCDSVNKVTILPVEPIVIDTVLCPSQKLYVNGKLILNNYSDTTCVDGDWSITIYSITYSKILLFEDYEEINPGDTYQWTLCDGTIRTLSAEGYYLDSCINQFGCDSINRLHLVVRKDKLYFEKDSACYNNLPYIWHGQSLEATGSYTAKYTTSMGRDSIFNIDFKVLQPIHQYLTIDTCYNGAPIVINGRPFNKDAAFVDTFPSIKTQCDSVVHYILRMHRPTSSYEQKQITQGKSIQWEGMTISSTGVYTKQFTDQYGCDSIRTLIATVCPQTQIGYRSIFACEGDVIRINGDTITVPGTYPEILKTTAGCDSIVYVKVDFSYTDYKYTTRYIYKGDTIPWRGKIYTKSGTYFDTIRTYNQLCDSVIYGLYLKAPIILKQDTTVFTCDGSFYHKGKGPYFNDSTIIDTIPNLDGKDSVYFSWNYRLVEHCSDFDTYYLCPGEPKVISGVVITKAGTYFTVNKTAQGLDSLYRFNVKDAYVYENTIQLEGCDSVVYSGVKFVSLGMDVPQYKTLHHTSIKYGCDSIEYLEVTVHESKRQYDHHTIPDYQLPFQYKGREYNAACTDTFSYYTKFGCDSLLILVLQVQPTFNDTTEIFYCKGDPNGVNIFGKKYYPQNDMVVDSLFHEGSKLVRRYVFVYVNQPFTITKFDDRSDQIVCAEEIVKFEVNYSVLNPNSGALPTAYDVDFFAGDIDAYPKSATYPVNGKQTLPIYMYGKGKSVNPGYYSYQIRFRSEGCPVSDTTFTGKVLVRYPAEIMESNWDNVVALVNEDYNAGHWYLQPPYSWQVWNSAGQEKTALVVPNSNVQPYIASDQLRENDVIIATLYREDYQHPIPSCAFTFKPVNYNGKHPILVYPTASKTSTDIHVETNSPGRYTMFNSTGHKCKQGAVAEGDNTVQLPGTIGCYLMQITLENGTSSLERVIVY